MTENSIGFNDKSRYCPLTFCTGSPKPCRTDCAWYTQPDTWEQGECALLIAACSLSYTSSCVEEITIKI